MFRKLIKKLYFKYCSPDLSGMTRKQLGVFNKVEPIEEKQQQDIFYMDARALGNNSALKYIMEEVIENVEDDMLYRTEPSLMIYDRFTINGISLIRERIEYYGSLAPQVNVEFDKHSII